MIRSSFFNSVAGDRKYNASRFAEYFNSFIGNGVFPTPTNNLQVTSNDDMTLTVKQGKAWINGYIVINDDDYILSLDVADGLLKRIDRVVARYDVVDREIRIEIKQGTFASSPVAPTLQRDADAYELGIADILISNGVVSISQDNITDLRSNSELCGKVDSIIAGDINSLVADLFAHKADNISAHGVDILANKIDLNEIDITDINLAGTRLAASAVGSFTLPLGKVPTKHIKIYGGKFTFYCNLAKYYILVTTDAFGGLPKYYSYSLDEVVSDTLKVADWMLSAAPSVGDVAITKVTLSGTNLIFSLKNTVASYRDVKLVGSLEVL